MYSRIFMFLIKVRFVFFHSVCCTVEIKLAKGRAKFGDSSTEALYRYSLKDDERTQRGGCLERSSSQKPEGDMGQDLGNEILAAEGVFYFQQVTPGIHQNKALLESNQATKDANEIPSASNGDNDEWSEVQRLQARITTFRNTEIDKWHRKIQVTTGAAALKGKLHAFNQNISDQVAGYMRDPSRMINRMYLTNSAVRVFGKDVGEPGTAEEVRAFTTFPLKIFQTLFGLLQSTEV
ncbi:hypothetical protein Zm00014a_001005 [Zea mays]|uniref:Uncharacterized protein n=1 Tax=Zea mays TaxID=4577 RepID=A0A3L6FG70_MAIZE|nr:hypothetical protein Zm00014a_001005 [Zea mays]